MTTLGQRIRGLFACLALLALVVAFPTVLIAIGFAPWDADLDEFRRMLTRPDDGSLALAAFAAVGWGAWVVVTASVLLAAAAEVRRVPAPRMPGLALPQRFAAELVGTAALLFVAAPSMIAVLPSPPAHSVAPAVPEPPASTNLEPVATPAPHAATDGTPAPVPTETRDYTVARGDSLWRIAERLLGDGARFTELVELNTEALDGRPDFITPGTVIRVPAVAPMTPDTVTVQPGDTLSEIAEQELGDGTRYPEIFEASRATEQPGGAHLEDPDLIRPGWHLTLPQAEEPPSDQSTDNSDTEQPPIIDPPPADELTPHAEPTQPPAEAAPPAAEADDASAQGAPAWLLPGVAAGGLLAGAVLLAVRAHRRTQLRYRKPGQTLAANPPELLKIDKTTLAHGERSLDDIEGLDAALNHLAARARDTETSAPTLVSVSLLRGQATFHFADPVDLASPWSGEGQVWRVDLGSVQGDDDVLSPYPMLISVGRDTTGALVLVNLEPIGSIALLGNPDHARAFARHAAAELALNPWSVLVQTDTFGLGDELGDLDTLRLRTHAVDDPAIESVVSEIRAASQRRSDVPDPWQVVITSTSDMAPVIESARAAAAGRLGVAILTFDAGAPPDATLFGFSPTGRLTAPTLGLDVQAAGLTAEEAALCASIVDVTRVTPTTDIPHFSQAADGWRSITDQAGALHTELTRPRPPGTAGATSLLPANTRDYVEAAAATEEDVSELAPCVVDDAAQALADLDPSLDEDIAAWFDDDSRLPRLSLLGPVRVTAHGNLVEQIVKRRPYYSELLAFVALHPEGVLSRAISEAFHIGQPRARTDMGYIREWLGKSPLSGEWHIPKQGDHPEVEWHGYQVDDLLVDVDLFRRLRARGQARGADGIADLVQALHLVGGKPFDQLREQGWSWLLDGERLQDLIPCAIVDTAHIVVLDALQRGDLELARESAETACKAAPYDEVSRLDLAKVVEAQGHVGAAEEMLREDVFDRRDDYEPPVDLPLRTKEIVKNNGWGQRRMPPARKGPPRSSAS